MPPVFRSGLVSPEGASGGERGLCVGPGWGLAQAPDLVRHGGRSASSRTQGKNQRATSTRLSVEFVLWAAGDVDLCVFLYECRWWTCLALWRWRFTLLRSSSVSTATWRTWSRLSSVAPTPYVSLSLYCHLKRFLFYSCDIGEELV